MRCSWWEVTLQGEAKREAPVRTEPHPTQVRRHADTLYVFNLRGNRHRFICAIHFNRKKLFIREFLTHADYSKQGWKTRH
jgi:mRNA interferase HigB